MNSNIVAASKPSKTALPTECITVTAVFSTTVSGIGGVVVDPLVLKIKSFDVIYFFYLKYR
jgi:hypothetical protein